MIGARPEIIQAAPVSAALRERADEILVHTGQHYDERMSEGQIRATGLPTPDHNLGVGSLPRPAQIALAQERLSEVIRAERVDAVLVRGDTNATLSGARAAAETGATLIHVEAGLRSHRLDMPEEHNRIETDQLSQLLLAPTAGARANLVAEGVAGAIRVTGDPLCDSHHARCAGVVAAPGEYMLATIHRNYNTDDPQRLAAAMRCLERSPWPVVLPVHPRTQACLRQWAIEVPDNVELTEPASYTRMLELECGAQVIATDSGGVQREAYLWGVPCITLREETEWVDTVQAGWNTVVGVDADAFSAALARPRPRQRPPIFGDGDAARRIADEIALFIETTSEVTTYA